MTVTLKILGAPLLEDRQLTESDIEKKKYLEG